MSTKGLKLNPQRVSYHVNDGVHLVGEAWGASAAAPVLLLHGGGQTRHAWGGTARALAEQGWYASEETTKEFLAAVPHAKYVDVAGAGHMVAGDRNDAFSKAVIEFLAEVKPLL